ncbi:spermidine/putrescine import ATP-binding protein PotA [Alsobacter metallidurans]|uniref:Spermidine/putrescine import ATP-binding protein PotA n=1 Tax=Alsobacter metallidurans TaxID=340221 RepID=A0A917MGY3_9HYPH|nr:ABC transporter ATP-binding protein [Alsobacter metallidurans]GGH17879.1 spermidine/putrescine import ATP-binding protein PotA [Alsobacter metallidurans]
MSHLVIDNVSKSFGELPVLRGCSLSVEKGSVLTLLGPSGCGKTTLLRTIAGFITPDAGRIVVQGNDISDMPPNRREVGYVFQNYALFPHLTIAANVAYGLKVRRTSRAEVARRVEDALRLVDLSTFADRYPAQLSGGQQQRVAIARSLVLEPSVLLLDEPFNALDARLRLTMQIELRKLIQRVGITSIFVTHDQMEAMTLSDTVAVMHKGVVEQFGSPLDIYDRPRTAYVANFIGRANVIPGEVANGHFDDPARIATQAPAGPAVLVVRPENVTVEPATAGDAAPGWPGTVTFTTALGPTVEYEIDCGWPEPLRAIAPRSPGRPQAGPGDRVVARIADPAAAVVLRRQDGAHVH